MCSPKAIMRAMAGGRALPTICAGASPRAVVCVGVCVIRCGVGVRASLSERECAYVWQGGSGGKGLGARVADLIGPHVENLRGEGAPSGEQGEQSRSHGNGHGREKDGRGRGQWGGANDVRVAGAMQRFWRVGCAV